MITLEQYQNKYQNIRFERRNGILQVTLHSDGDTVQWNPAIHDELPEAFYMMGADHENRVIIITGTGRDFSGPRVDELDDSFFPYRPEVQWVERLLWEGNQLLMNMLNVPVPIISAVNGPATRHAEIPLLADIVLAAEHASFIDSAHFPKDQVPGDGMHIVFPMLMGVNRGRYFLLTGQELTAAEAKDIGLVAEVLPTAKLLPRAWELAEKIARKPRLLVRGTRQVLNEYIKRQVQDLLPYALYVEGLALLEKPERPGGGELTGDVRTAEIAKRIRERRQQK